MIPSIIMRVPCTWWCIAGYNYRHITKLWTTDGSIRESELLVEYSDFKTSISIRGIFLFWHEHISLIKLPEQNKQSLEIFEKDQFINWIETVIRQTSSTTMSRQSRCTFFKIFIVLLYFIFLFFNLSCTLYLYLWIKYSSGCAAALDICKYYPPPPRNIQVPIYLIRAESGKIWIRVLPKRH